MTQPCRYRQRSLAAGPGTDDGRPPHAGVTTSTAADACGGRYWRPHAVKAGLHVPLVYNCGGYESIETLHLLKDVIDIYMPDAKYSDGAAAARLSDAADYPGRMFEAIDEMHRQVGDLLVDAAGRAVRGLLVRHLVLPEGQAGTPDIMAFLAALSTQTYLNIMDQYRPCHRAHTVEALARPPRRQEYAEAVEAAHAAGLYRLDERN